MLADVDVSLRSWLGAALPAHTEIAFGSPAELAARSQRQPLVNLFLYAIELDTTGLAAAEVRIVDDAGRVSAIGQPARRYALTYQVTAWAGNVLDEHRLLGTVLVTHAGQDCLPSGHLHGSLGRLDGEIPVYIGTPHRAASWDSLGIPMRTSLELTVFAPAVAPASTDVAPPVENLELVAGQLPDQPVADGPPRRRWRRTSLTEP